MALFNTPSYNQSASALNVQRVPAPLVDNTPDVPWYMKQLQADDRVIGGPVQRQGLSGLFDQARAFVEQQNASQSLQKKYSNLVTSNRYDQARRRLDKWIQANPDAPIEDTTQYYQDTLNSVETRELSRSRALQELNHLIVGMPSSHLKNAYAEQLRIIDEMHNGRNASNDMQWKPTPKSRTNASRFWDKSRADSYTI